MTTGPSSPARAANAPRPSSLRRSGSAAGVATPPSIRSPPRSAAARKVLQQSVDQPRLGRQELTPGGLRVEPLGAVDLRKLPLAARAWRPFHREAVALQGRGVEVGLRGPGLDDLGPLAH